MLSYVLFETLYFDCVITFFFSCRWRPNAVLSIVRRIAKQRLLVWRVSLSFSKQRPDGSGNRKFSTWFTWVFWKVRLLQ